MTMVSSFYAVLPSNASYKTFKNNKLHTYKVQIPRLPSAEGEWVVGLTEISYPSRWPNITDLGWVYIKWKNSEEPMSYPIESGFYSSIPFLLERMEYILSLNKSGVESKLSFVYEEFINRVGISIAQNVDFTVSFSDNIAACLGFESNKQYSIGYTRAPFPADINDGLTALYVYSDIVQKRLVGDDMVPLLKVVPAQPMKKQYSHSWVKFQNVEYVPSVKTHIDTVEINIRRDNGDIIPFENGKVVVTLHFKRVS